MTDRDPLDLPLFSSVVPPRDSLPVSDLPAGRRPGRVRSTWKYPGAAERPDSPVRLVRAEELPPGLQPRVSVDWSLVAGFRSQVAERLTRSIAGGLDSQAQQELGRAVILEVLDEAAAEAVRAGDKPWTSAEQDALAAAVFDAVFRLGRLQPLVDDPNVENIIITGADRVWLERVDGSLVRGPAVADSDAELVEFIAFLASRSGQGTTARPFSEASPSLDLRLPDGSRLAATNWLTATPSIVIRRHRLVHVTLEELVGLGTLTPILGSFLAAAVRARWSIVVAGAQGSGKTTLMRGLCAEIDPDEQLATFEDPYELFLHEMPERHHVVHAWEARHGSGEIGVDGRPAGEYTTERQLRDSFRYNASRQIVGEIRGPEVWAMVKAMESGSGSLSTTHSASAGAAMAKLVTCAMEAGPHVSRELATSKLGEAIDLVVQMHTQIDRRPDGTQRKRRWVSEIVFVCPGEAEHGYALTHVFTPTSDGPARASVLPDELRDLAAHGFDLGGFLTEAAQRRGPR